VTTPLFNVRVPVRAHHLADPEGQRHRDDPHVRRPDRRRGANWRCRSSRHQPDGTLSGASFSIRTLWASEQPGSANDAYGRVAGLSAARPGPIVELLKRRES
jgi:hypothetical protein